MGLLTLMLAANSMLTIASPLTAFADATKPSAASPMIEPTPPFQRTQQESVTIANDLTDLYFPTPSAIETPLPVALFLPGALVDKSQYSTFAHLLARYGFVVMVPSHQRSVPEFHVSGELAEISQVIHALEYVKAENDNPRSPLSGKLDTTKLALLGHSHGGAVALMAIENVCIYPFCIGEFTRPDAVVAGVFYGVNSYNPTTRQFRRTENQGIPVALIQGSEDGIATPEEGQTTYDLIADSPKALITVSGANHYGITNDNNPAGAVADRNPPELEHQQGIETIARWSGLFLRAYVWHDADAKTYVEQALAAPNAAVHVISQP